VTTGRAIAAGVALSTLIRAPWFDAALGRDEGGVAMVAHAWRHGGPFLYGHVFLDRPPLLVALYKLAGDPAGIRLLGAVAAALLVTTSTLLAVRLAGRAAAPYAAIIAALLASSPALKAVLTPAELLAAVPSSASVLLLVTAIERQRRSLRLYAAAGALGASALLIKQSFGDAMAAGAVALMAGKLSGTPWRETARRAAAYAAGIAAVAATLAAWAIATHTSAASILYALFGFRLDAVHALAGGGTAARIHRLAGPFLESGLVLAFPVALVGIARLRARRAIRAALAAWLAAACAGVLLGGSYWPHYLIALVSVTAAGAAAALARQRWGIAVVAVTAMAAAAVLTAAPTVLHDGADGFDQGTRAVGDYLSRQARPGDTAYVLYTDANLIYYSGLRPAFPYNWSLMMRAVPGAQDQLRAALGSPSKRPTWIVVWQPAGAWGLDRSGATRRLLARDYVRVATVCGHPVLRARAGSPRPALVRMDSASSCPTSSRISTSSKESAIAGSAEGPARRSSAVTSSLTAPTHARNT
jgi:hypothetical protein